MKRMNKLISIIVSIYNIQDYLGKCVKSIINQTYTDLEVILVDDGSTDDSRFICDKYAKEDKRITVIHKSNGGLVSARKAGLNTASGDFVMNIDGDDWIEPFFIQQMVENQNNTGADIVTSNLSFDIGESQKKLIDGIAFGVYNTSYILDKMLYMNSFYKYGINPHLCSKLIKRDLLVELQNDVDDRIIVGEDAAVVYPCIISAKQISVSDICGYHYVQRPCSMTKKINSDELERCNILFDFLKKSFNKLGVWDIMKNQINQYIKYIYILRNISVFDIKNDMTCLLPYGNIHRGSDIILYGAGGVGQKIYRYIKDTECVNVVAWLDRNYIFYQKYALPVEKPELVKSFDENIPIIVANIDENEAKSIRDSLNTYGVNDKNILWFSKEFIEMDSVKFLN